MRSFKQAIAAPAVQTLMLQANVGISNNPTLPVLIYPAALSVTERSGFVIRARIYGQRLAAAMALRSIHPPPLPYSRTRGLGVYAGHARLMLAGSVRVFYSKRQTPLTIPVYRKR